MKQFLEKAALAAICGLVMGLTLLVGVHCWQPATIEAADEIPDVVKAKSFQVVGKNGKVCAELKAFDNGGGALQVYGTTDKSLLQLGVFNDGAEESPALLLNGPNNKPRVELWGWDNPRLLLLDKTSTIASFGYDADYCPGMRFTSLLKKKDCSILSQRIAIELDKDGSPSISLNDKDDKPRTQIGVTHLINPKTEDETITPESSIVLFDKDGNVSWKAPLR